MVTKKITATYIAIATAIILFPTKAIAATLGGSTDPIGSITLPVGIKYSQQSVYDFIPSLLITVIFGCLIAALIYLLYGGIKWIMSSGDQKALASARETIIQAIVGTVMLAIVYALALLAQTILRPAVSVPSGGPATNGAACNPVSNPCDRTAGCSCQKEPPGSGYAPGYEPYTCSCRGGPI